MECVAYAIPIGLKAFGEWEGLDGDVIKNRNLPDRRVTRMDPIGDAELDVACRGARVTRVCVLIDNAAQHALVVCWRGAAGDRERPVAAV